MSSVPRSPQYRITLFYGPETVDDNPPRHSCIFNVKKRSWKSGVQVVVEVTNAQLATLNLVTEFEPWMGTVLARVPVEEQTDYASRARDLFIQGICSLKLDLAIDRGLAQENQPLSATELVEELGSAVPHKIEFLRTHILSELDLAV